MASFWVSSRSQASGFSTQFAMPQRDGSVARACRILADFGRCSSGHTSSWDMSYLILLDVVGVVV